MKRFDPLDLYKGAGSFQSQLDYSLHKNEAIELISQRQQDFLTALIRRRGKPAYLAAKNAVGIDQATTIQKLSKAEAARLIAFLHRGNSQ